MTQEEKELLIKDLCARLPYGVQVFVERDKYAQATLLGVNTKQFSITFGGSNWSGTSNIEGHHIEQYKQLIKPYLRPMSSMTEEEMEELQKLQSGLLWRKDVLHDIVLGIWYRTDAIDYLNEHHLDYHNLIEKSLALEAPQDMYK